MKKEEKEVLMKEERDTLIIFLDDDEQKKTWWIKGYEQDHSMTTFSFSESRYMIPNHRIIKIKTPEK